MEFFTSAIIEGRLEGGQRLIESEFQRRFGTSRAPIREAFRILEQKGLVVSLPRKGTFVRAITKKDVEDQFPIRAVLEGLAARLAVPNLGSEELGEMELAFSQMKDAAASNNFKAYLEHHAKYHDVFLFATKNDTLIGIIKNLRRQAIWFRFIYRYFQESYEYSVQVHGEILDLFKKKETDRVELLVRDHILISLRREDWERAL